MRKPFRRHRRDDGAAAVEFALVMPILFLVMFGIIQYGLWFNDALNTRSGVREGARVGVTAQFTETGCTAANQMDQLACKTAKRIDALTGTAYVKVSTSAWTKGTPLTVCALVKTETPGLLSMPDDGWIFSRTQMSIENINGAPTVLNGSYNSLPGTQTWPAGC